MSNIIHSLRKNKQLDYLFKRLIFIKLWKRNYQAKPIRKEQANLSIQQLESLNPVLKHVYFVCVPQHKNMGDQAQRYCIRNWIKSYYPDYEIIELPSWPFYESSFKRRLDGVVKPEDIFIVQSGYCTTSTHYDHYVHRYIARKYRDNPILIMPQTVNFLTDWDGYKTGKIYSCCSKMLFLARDKISFKSAKKFFVRTNVELFPDIVTSLIGTMDFNENRDGVLLCIRNDSERKYSHEDIEKIRTHYIGKKIRCDVNDTNTDADIEALINSFDSELKKVIQNFASYKVVITDRYHGTIFSMIANTPVVVLATLDHKVKTGTEWFNGIYDEMFYNASGIEDAYGIADTLLKRGEEKKNPPYFKTAYYDKLAEKFDEIRGTL